MWQVARGEFFFAIPRRLIKLSKQVWIVELFCADAVCPIVPFLNREHSDSPNITTRFNYKSPPKLVPTIYAKDTKCKLFAYPVWLGK